MTDFWQGFITAIALIAVSIIVAALWSYRRQERKRQAEGLGQPPSIAAPDLARLRKLISIEAADGLTTGEVVEFNAVLQRLQKAPISPVKQGKKGIH